MYESESSVTMLDLTLTPTSVGIPDVPIESSSYYLHPGDYSYPSSRPYAWTLIYLAGVLREVDKLAMTIRVGYTNGSLSCRFLGRDNNDNITNNSLLYKLPNISMMGDTLCHNEGTAEYGGTIPCIGSGSTMNTRRYAMCGYCVGNTLSVPDASPVLIDRKRDHVLAYDLEVEYYGPNFCSLRNPILCSSLVCTCGYIVIISRSDVRLPSVTCIRVYDNEEMSETIMRLISSHNPIFIVGHNVYDFDNVKIAVSLPSDSKYRRYFN